MAEPAPAPPPAREGAVRSARWALGVLTLINLFNYLDRYVPAALVESLRRSELHVTDTQAGWLGSGFMAVFMLTSPLFGALGDRRRRPPLVAIGVAIWSLMTALAGLARSFSALLVARSAAGIGEAAYINVSPALLADSFPRGERGRVFAIFNAAMPIGAAAGYILGGLIGQRFGWRAAFFIAGVPGLLLAVAVWRLQDPPRGGQDAPAGDLGEPGAAVEMPAAEATGSGHAGLHAAGGPAGGRVTAVYAELLRNRPFMLTVLGYAAYTFALGALAFWTPSFLERERGMPASEATVLFGAIVVVTAFIGTFAGGWLGDLLLRRWRESYLWVSGLATLAAAPVALVAFVSPSRPVYMSAIVGAEVLLFLSTGPVNSALVNVVTPAHRATAMAVNTLLIHLLGDVPSQPLIGRISDATSLGTAFLVLPAMMAVGGLIWTYAAWRGERDARRGPRRA
jgi:MFS transporter, Spinster family, sphingosine-1-phosphate transporter